MAEDYNQTGFTFNPLFRHYLDLNALDCTGRRELGWKVGFFPKFLTVGLRANDRADYGSWRAAAQPEEH
jgi:hypothetical protein